MSGYKRFPTAKINFNGDTVTIKFRRFKRSEYMQLQPFIEETKGGTVDLKFESQKSLMEITEFLLPKVLVDFSGLTIDGENYHYSSNGSEESKEDFVELITEAYFVPLVSEILGVVMGESVPASSSEDEKKSGNTPKESSKE